MSVRERRSTFAAATALHVLGMPRHCTGFILGVSVTHPGPARAHAARAFRRCWWARNRQGTCDQDRGHVRAAQLRQRRRARRTSTMPARPHRAQQLTAHRLTTHKTTGAQSHWSTKETKLSISPLYLIRSCIDLSFYLYFTDLAARASRTYSSSMSPAACRRSSRSSGTVPRALLGA